MKITSETYSTIFLAYLGPIKFMTHLAHCAHHNVKSIFVPILQLIYSWDTNFACNNTFTQSDYSSLSSLNSCTALNSYGKIDIPSRDGLQAKALGTRLVSKWQWTILSPPLEYIALPALLVYEFRWDWTGLACMWQRPPIRMMLEIAVDKRNSFRLNFCQAKLVHLTLLVASLQLV